MKKCLEKHGTIVLLLDNFIIVAYLIHVSFLYAIFLFFMTKQEKKDFSSLTLPFVGKTRIF